jgi:hypothetical protein
MNTYSVTQTANITALAGVIVWIASSFFKVDLVPSEIEQVIAAGLILVGIITSFVNRYQKGDVSILGKFK